MNEKRKSLIFVLGVLALAVFTVSVAYAALSVTLKIGGRAEISSASWDIRMQEFRNETVIKKFLKRKGITNYSIDGNIVIVGGAKNINNGKISDTLVKDLEWNFSAPGDKILSFYTISNYGTITAARSEWEFLKPSYSGSNNDVSIAQENFEFKVEFINRLDGSVNNNVTLCNGDPQVLVIEAGIKDVVSSIPNGNITISNFGGFVTYSQSNYICEVE